MARAAALRQEVTMIRSVKQLEQFDIVATDGSIGSIKDFYFDDERWVVRYLVVDTGKWLPGRRVLVSPFSVGGTDWNEHRVRLSITREQVRHSPDIDLHKPVSRQHEAEYLKYYGYPLYWAHTGLWGAYPTPMPPAEVRAVQYEAAMAGQPPATGDSHLRSTQEVIGYMIRATDGELGHVNDFLIDDATWAVRYFVINTSNWWFGKQVLASPSWISVIQWASKAVDVNVTRQAIRSAPPYDPAAHIDRLWEETYHRHLQQPGYWTGSDGDQAISAAKEALRREEEPTGDPLERGVRPR
jgi:hypothetical protein